MIQKIREATALLFGNLSLYGAIVLTVWLLPSILLIYLRLHSFPMMNTKSEGLIDFQVSCWLELAFGPFCTGAILYATDRLQQGWPATYTASMSYGAKQSLRLLGARLVCGFIVLLGLILLIIPGIILALRLALIEPIVVLERSNGFDARKRSTELTQGIKWQILGTNLLTYVWSIIVIFLLTVIRELAFSLVGQSESFSAQVIGQLIGQLAWVIPTIVCFLFYWEAKQKRRTLN
jgi:hypothetical protein